MRLRRVQRFEDLLLTRAQRIGQLQDSGRMPEASRQLRLRLPDLEHELLHIARRPDRPPSIAKVPPQLAQDRGDREARKGSASRAVETIRRVDQPDACDLDQILHRLGAGGACVAGGQAACERKKALDQLVTVARRSVAFIVAMGVGHGLSLSCPTSPWLAVLRVVGRGDAAIYPLLASENHSGSIRCGRLSSAAKKPKGVKDMHLTPLKLAAVLAVGTLTL